MRARLGAMPNAVVVIATARVHHESHKTKRDHADAVRKARTVVAFAEEAIIFQSP